MELEQLLPMWAIVCPLVFFGALMDAVAGGGGLLSLPSYLLAGLDPHMAIGTNKLGNLPGMITSATSTGSSSTSQPNCDRKAILSAAVEALRLIPPSLTAGSSERASQNSAATASTATSTIAANFNFEDFRESTNILPRSFHLKVAYFTNLYARTGQFSTSQHKL